MKIFVNLAQYGWSNKSEKVRKSQGCLKYDGRGSWLVGLFPFALQEALIHLGLTEVLGRRINDFLMLRWLERARRWRKHAF